MDSMEELYKGLSDIPLLLAALCFACRLKTKYPQKREWIRFFLVFSAAALLGIIVHVFSLSTLWHNIIWAELYVLLVSTVKKLVRLLNIYVSGEDSYPEWLTVAGVVLYIAAVILLLSGSKYDIYVFLIFGALNLIWLFRKLSENETKPHIRALFAVCGIGLLCQLLKSVIPYGVVWEHLMFLFAVVLLFNISTEDFVEDQDICQIEICETGGLNEADY